MAKSPNTTTAPTGQIAPFGLRMLPELKEQIESAAKASGRSMNAEIVARLQASFESQASMSMTTIHKNVVETVSAQPTADEIADKVAEKLSGGMIQPFSLDSLRQKYLLPEESSPEDLYRRFARLLAMVENDQDFKRHEAQVRKSDNTPHGPARSPNARKPRP